MVFQLADFLLIMKGLLYESSVYFWGCFGGHWTRDEISEFCLMDYQEEYFLHIRNEY